MAANIRELGVVKVASPCQRDWDEMTGDARARFCKDCKLNVYNLSEMTTDEAHQLIREKEGKLCVRFFTREDGTVLTRDCPVGVQWKRAKLIAAGSTAIALSLSALALSVSEIFADAPSESCAAPAPIAPAPAAVKAPEPQPDDRWMEQRRNQLAPREGRAVMGKMHSIQVIRGAEDEKP